MTRLDPMPHLLPRVLAGLLLLAAGSGCFGGYAMQLRQPQLSAEDESFLSPEFKPGPTSAFVVRAGVPSQDAVGSRASMDAAAANLEIALQRGGFIVRDRQLVEARLRQAASPRDYEQIATDTGVEYIAEVAEVREGRAVGYDFLRVSGGEVTSSEAGHQVPTWEVAVDVVRVRDNRRMGRLTGAASVYSVAAAQGLWPFPDPSQTKPVEQFEDGELVVRTMDAFRRVPGATCKRANFPWQCRFEDASVPVRHALGQIVRKLSPPRQ